jgi:tetratricopeptide (TPR) repeat protein
MHWVLFAILTVLYLIAPYRRGLFFDQDLYWKEGLVLLLLLIWCISKIVKKERGLPVKYYAIFLVPVMYALAFFFAESPQYNFDNWLRWLTYAGVFILLTDIGRHSNVRQWMHYLFQASGIVLALFSLAGFLGWVDYRDIMLGTRLAGPLQYANTFAAVIGAFWLYALFVYAKGKLNQTQIMLYCAPLVVYGVTFLLSYSRGAWLVLPIAWFIGLWLLSFREQLRLVGITAISLLFSFVVYLASTLWNLSNGLLFVLLLACSALVCLCVWGAEVWLPRVVKWDWLHSGKRKVIGRIAVPASMAVLGLLLLLDLMFHGAVYRTLPTGLQNRIGTINLETSSVVARIGMYQDALRISVDHPFGAGGDGWKILYNLYQKLPYYSNEIHNGYLEVLLSIGWMGMLVFFGVFSLLFVLLLRKGDENTPAAQGGAAAFAALAVLFLHAAIDFDFSYGFVWFMIVWLFAMHSEVPAIIPEKKRKQKKTTPVKMSPSIALVTVRSIISVLAVIGMVTSYRFMAAERAAAQVQGQIQVDQAIALFKKAVSNNSYNVNFRIALANAYLQHHLATGQSDSRERFEQQVLRMEKLEPHNARMLFQIGSMYAQLNEWDKCFQYIDKAIKFERYNVEYYLYAIDMKTRVGLSLLAQNQVEEGNRKLEQAVELFETYQEWYSEVLSKPVPDRRDISLSRDAKLMAARAYLNLNHLEPAFQIVKQFNPAMDQGIYDADQNKLLVSKFDFVTLEQFIASNENHTLILSVRDEATKRLPSAFVEKIQSKGSKIGELMYRGSYVAVISKGQLIEEIVRNDGEITITPETSPKVGEVLKNKSFTITSAGLPYGNRSSIVVDGQEFSRNERGINIAVFNENGDYLYSFSFDTHKSDVRVYKTGP